MTGGGQFSGRIALVTGGSGVSGPDYAASKAGLHGLTHNQLLSIDGGMYPR